MSAWRPELHVDVAGPARGAVPLVPQGGAFAVAMRGLVRGGQLARVPFEVPLTIYAYELLERLREAAGAAPAAVHVPFWPAALFAAADVTVHAGDDLEAMYPAFAAVYAGARDVAATQAAADQVFGCAPFDVARYPLALADLAARRHWRCG